MSVTHFNPEAQRSPNSFGFGLSHLAYPLQPRTPQMLEQLLKKLR